MRLFLWLCPVKRLTVLAGLLPFLFAQSAIAATTPKYVQGNYAVPQTPEPTVTVPYTAGQTAGNLNVVIVGWADSTTHVTSVTDANGNPYWLAVGPIVTGTLSQAIYYAKNISAGATAMNSVTVKFNAAANFPDIRILEYSGVDPANPVDTVVGGAGNSGTSDSGAVTTTNAIDLLVAANTVQTTTSAPNSGFTQRLLTNPDSDIAEDKLVTETGSYSASALLGGAGGWVMQMVAFRAAVTATPAPTPTPTPTPTPAAPAYVQGNYAVPQTPQTAVTVLYTAAQTAGDLNVVIVGWADPTAHLTSLSDSNGNSYQLAIGPTVTGTLSQAMFYAKNISAAKAASNSVTVTFDSGASFPDIRILEYSGIDRSSPVDSVAGTTGNSATSSSGGLTNTNGFDLLVAANTVLTTTIGAGSGFTQRLLTNPDSNIAEDELVTKAGSYSATTQLGGAGDWVMQMVAFRAASSVSTPTQNPTSPPTANSSITLAWSADRPTSDPATNTVGYRLYLGVVSGVYTQSTDVGKITTTTVSNLVSGFTYYGVVTAYNSDGAESLPSNEVSYAAP